MPRENFVANPPASQAVPNAYGWWVPSPLTGETVGQTGLRGHMFQCATPTGATLTHVVISSPTPMTVHFGIPGAAIAGTNLGVTFWTDTSTPGSPASVVRSKFFTGIEGGLGPEYFIGAGITRIDLQQTLQNGEWLVCAPRIASNLFRVTWYWFE